MNYVYAKHFRKLTDFTVKNIYPSYRSGGVKGSEGFIGRSFKVEGGNLLELTFVNNSPNWAPPAGDILVHDKEQEEGKKTYPIAPETAMKNKFFWKTYPKVYDVVINTPSEVSVEDTKGETVNVTELTIKALGAFKVKEMIKADIDFDVPMNESGDKEKFDWEDDVYKNVVGVTYKMKVTGVDLETEYRINKV